jgi:hypothetical protein
MFWRKKEPKVQDLSPQEILTNRIEEEIEKLALGQTLIYKLPEFYWAAFGVFVMAELNPSYPQKGKKYIMSKDGMVDGKPAGRKFRLWDSNKARIAAEFIAESQTERAGKVERFHEAASQKTDVPGK